MAKKRYVGFKYENIDDLEPVFDAKGIETVRRDGVLAQRKMVENCLKCVERPIEISRNLKAQIEFCSGHKTSAKSKIIAADPGQSCLKTKPQCMILFLLRKSGWGHIGTSPYFSVGNA